MPSAVSHASTLTILNHSRTPILRYTSYLLGPVLGGAHLVSVDDVVQPELLFRFLT